MQTLAVVLIGIAVLAAVAVLLGAAILKLACRIHNALVPQREVPRPTYRKALMVVLASGAAAGAVNSALASLPGSYQPMLAMGEAVPEILRQVRFNVFAPAAGIVIEGGLLSALLPTQLGRGVVIAVIRITLSTLLLVGIALIALAAVAALLGHLQR